jgi:predicted metal-binding membrane protein
LNARLEAVLRRDRWLVAAGLIAVTAVAWVYMAREAREMSLSGVCHCAGMRMSGLDVQAWSVTALVPLFLMWAEMMVAMMLPSATPLILAFAMVNRQRRVQELPYVPTAVFTLGYLAAWVGFSAVAAVGQWVLHSLMLLSSMMMTRSSWLAGGLLIGAGIFQWTPLKHACLKHCRSPLSFLLNDWQEGRKGALMMGLRNGWYCMGCCWLLMALLFVAGVMNLWWVGLITLFVLAEKIAPQTWRLGSLAGVILVVWGILVSTGALAPKVAGSVGKQTQRAQAAKALRRGNDAGADNSKENRKAGI